MQIFARLVLLLPAADRKLVLFYRDLDLLLGETGHRQSDAQLLRVGAGCGDALDVVRGIAVARRLRHLVERTLDIVESEQERRAQRRYTHHRKPLEALHATQPSSRSVPAALPKVLSGHRKQRPAAGHVPYRFAGRPFKTA